MLVALLSYLGVAAAASLLSAIKAEVHSVVKDRTRAATAALITAGSWWAALVAVTACVAPQSVLARAARSPLTCAARFLATSSADAYQQLQALLRDNCSPDCPEGSPAQDASPWALGALIVLFVGSLTLLTLRLFRAHSQVSGGHPGHVSVQENPQGAWQTVLPYLSALTNLTSAQQAPQHLQHPGNPLPPYPNDVLGPLVEQLVAEALAHRGFLTPPPLQGITPPLPAIYYPMAASTTTTPGQPGLPTQQNAPESAAHLQPTAPVAADPGFAADFPGLWDNPMNQPMGEAELPAHQPQSNVP